MEGTKRVGESRDAEVDGERCCCCCCCCSIDAEDSEGNTSEDGNLVDVNSDDSVSVVKLVVGCGGCSSCGGGQKASRDGDLALNDSGIEKLLKVEKKVKTNLI